MSEEIRYLWYEEKIKIWKVVGNRVYVYHQILLVDGIFEDEEALKDDVPHEIK